MKWVYCWLQGHQIPIKKCATEEQRWQVAVKVKTLLTRSQADALTLILRPGVEEDDGPQSSFRAWDVWEMMVEAKERRSVWPQWPIIV
jgi:hypothetical protein